MMDSLVNLMFRCRHKRLTRPVSPVSKDFKSHGDAYVVCLDCGKQFRYDLTEMRIGKALPTSGETGVLPPGMPGPRRSKFSLAVMAAFLPLGIAVGSLLTSKRRPKPPKSTEP
jgi:hypothetical protein